MTSPGPSNVFPFGACIVFWVRVSGIEPQQRTPLEVWVELKDCRTRAWHKNKANRFIGGLVIGQVSSHPGVDRKFKRPRAAKLELGGNNAKLELEVESSVVRLLMKQTS